MKNTCHVGPPLLHMSDAEFAELRSAVVPRSVQRMGFKPDSAEAIEWIFSGYSERLLFKNERLRQVAEQCAGDVTSPGCWNCLTPGQRFLYCLGTLDCEVPNGGLTQFFWNNPNIIFETRDALQAVGEEDLAVAYKKAVGTLVANHEGWIRLHSAFDSEPTNFQPFQASYHLLDLDWFDEAYFDKYQAPLRASAVAYVEAHKRQFITG